MDSLLLSRLNQNGKLHIPRHTLLAINDYIIYGMKPGGFLTAIITKKVAYAVFIADAENAKHFVDVVKMIEYGLPTKCKGTMGKVNQWCAMTDEKRLKYLMAMHWIHDTFELLRGDDRCFQEV